VSENECRRGKKEERRKGGRASEGVKSRGGGGGRGEKREQRAARDPVVWGGGEGVEGSKKARKYDKESVPSVEKKKALPPNLFPESGKEKA